MDPNELEHLVGERLRRLPAPRAPHTLLPRVMAAARLAGRPWYARSWFTWPRIWQVSSAAALLVIVASLTVAGAVAGQYAPEIALPIDISLVETAGAAATRTAVVLRALTILGRTITDSMFGLLPLLFLIMFATTVVLGTAISRVAMGRVHQS